jgi:hypothetical protein
VASGLQLILDGREELLKRAAREAPLTAAQVAILRALAERGTITSAEAGRIVHWHREPRCEQCQRGCCGFTATDGSKALKRLQARGLAAKVAAALWTAASAQSATVRSAGPAPSARRGIRGPKGARVGDVVIAEGSRWRVESLDPARRQGVCRLLAGSHVQRRFRARQIVNVERAAT